MSCPLSQWCQPTIASSVVPFSSCLQSFPPQGLFKWVSSLHSVQSLSCERLFATPWIPARQASLSINSYQSLLKLMSIKSVMPSNHLILCCPFLLPPSTFPSIRVFSNESVLLIRWPKYWSFSFNISPSNDYSGQISCRTDCLDLLAVQESKTPGVFSNFTVQKYQLFSTKLSLWSSSHIHTWLPEKP